MIELFDHVYNCAHRGASGLAPENTLAALALAVEQGADMAEIDVQQTADGYLVVLHDDDLNRTTNGQGRVATHSLADLRRLDAGAWFDPRYEGESVPLLTEAMSRARGRLALNIELKATDPGPRFLDALLADIRDQDFASHCVVTSFNRDLVNELAAREPTFAVGYVIGRAGLPAGSFNARVDLLSLEKSIITADVIEFAAAAGKAVHAWTVDQPAEMGRLLALGVDGVITNYPDRLSGLPAGAGHETSERRGKAD